MSESAMHVTLDDDRASEYLLEQELPDGRLLLRPDSLTSRGDRSLSGSPGDAGGVPVDPR